jgi:hypothetical protein
VLFEFHTPFQWPHGEPEFPADTVVVSYDCWFPDDEDEVFPEGQYIVYAV